MAQLCRFDAFEVIAAQLEGGEYSVDVCAVPATSRTVVQRYGDGLTVSVDVEVCDAHERVVAERPGYRRSIKKRKT